MFLSHERFCLHLIKIACSFAFISVLGLCGLTLPGAYSSLGQFVHGPPDSAVVSSLSSAQFSHSVVSESV